MKKRRHNTGDIVTVILLLIIVAIGGFVYWSKTNETNAYRHLVQQIEASASAEMGNVAVEDKRDPNGQLLIYYPVDETNQPKDPFATQLNLVTPTLQKQQNTIKVLSYKKDTTLLANHIVYRLIKQHYNEAIGQYFGSEAQTLATIYQTEQGEWVTFEDLFDQLLFDRKQINVVLSDAINATEFDESTKQVLKEQLGDLKQMHYHFTDKVFYMIGFDKEQNMLPVAVPMAKIVPYFKPTYVYPEYKKDYDQQIDAIKQERSKEKETVLRQLSDSMNQREAKKQIALTFDDGPSAETTVGLLDTLKKHDVKATFYILGERVPGSEDILKREVAEGHELGNHSFTHANFLELSTEALKEEVSKTQNIIREATGVTPKTLRPPYGAINKQTAEVVDLPIILWDVDSLDWSSRNVSAIQAEVSRATRNGSIILLHDIHPESVSSIDYLITVLKEAGYEFVTVSELYESHELVSGIQYLNQTEVHYIE